MGMGQWYKDKQGFKWTEITEEEEKQLQEELRIKNLEIIKECLEDASKIRFNETSTKTVTVGNFLVTDEAVLVACNLFDKRATQFFSVQKAFLDDKCRKLREVPASEDAPQSG